MPAPWLCCAGGCADGHWSAVEKEIGGLAVWQKRRSKDKKNRIPIPGSGRSGCSFSFAAWEGSLMTTTRIMLLHKGKGRPEIELVSERIDDGSIPDGKIWTFPVLFIIIRANVYLIDL